MEKVLTGIGVLALCAMFMCMGMCIESTSILCTVLSIAGIVASSAIAIYASNSVEYDDDTE